MKQNIGFIGLGNLGTPIALNLVKSGHNLHVYNRTTSKAEPLKAQGAIVCESVSDLSKQCNIVFTIVSDDAALKSICEGDNGLINNLAKESIHVSLSTILPKTAEELFSLHEQHSQHYLASPVFGRPDAAQQSKLNFCFSGEEKIRKQIEPLLKDAGGMNVFDFGNVITAANTVK
ncbi:MAG: NAD(P)-dependent oxidoreductase, partial [Bacteroidota bacterium]|nr:NAD(P)-dependent oxidoreductase [Bacteroidota bacterium]